MTAATAATGDGARSRWTWSGALRAMLVAGVALGIGAALGYLIAHEPAPHDDTPRSVARPRATDAERALLSPLREGGTLAGFEILEIRSIGHEGSLTLVCRKGGRETVTLSISLAGGPSPPATAGRYAVYYALDRATSEDGERLANALAAILRTNAAIAPPPGLGPFVMDRGGSAPN